MRKYLAIALVVILGLGLYNLAFAQNFPGASGNPSPLTRAAGGF